MEFNWPGIDRSIDGVVMIAVVVVIIGLRRIYRHRLISMARVVLDFLRLSRRFIRSIFYPLVVPQVG